MTAHRFLRTLLFFKSQHFRLRFLTRHCLVKYWLGSVCAIFERLAKIAGTQYFMPLPSAVTWLPSPELEASPNMRPRRRGEPSSSLTLTHLSALSVILLPMSVLPSPDTVIVVVPRILTLCCRRSIILFLEVVCWCKSTYHACES